MRTRGYAAGADLLVRRKTYRPVEAKSLPVDKPFMTLGSVVIFMAAGATLLQAGEETKPSGPVLIHIGNLGLVYASQAAASGNRLVRQWTVGFNHRLNTPSLWGSMLMSLQYSHLDRAVWSGREGQMDYLMYRCRYTFN